MSGKTSVARGVATVVVITAAAFAAMLLVYVYSPTFHGLFVNNPQNVESIMGEVAENSSLSAAHYREVVGYMIFGIFAAVICLQIVVFGAAMLVTGNIVKGDGSSENKLRRLENANIFFDLPLYIGLFGTISSFMVVAFSRESSLLIAYSTTLLGIIFSVILHVAVLYRARRNLLDNVG